VFTFFSYDDHEIVDAVDGVKFAADGQVFTVRIVLAKGVRSVRRTISYFSARQRVDGETKKSFHAVLYVRTVNDGQEKQRRPTATNLNLDIKNIVT